MKPRFLKVLRLKEFEGDLKKLKKRYKTLEEDLEVFVHAQLLGFHLLGLDNKGVVHIDDLGSVTTPIYKGRKFACRSLKGKGVRSGIRVIYAYVEKDQRIELIEIYCKADKDTEDRERIKNYYSKTLKEQHDISR